MRLLVPLLFVASCLFGQGNTGNILGTITDPSAAVVPGVKVLVTNVETGVQTSTVTDSLGNYSVQFLPAGTYRVEAEAAGFKKFVRENIKLDISRQLRVDVKLETGAITESVSVTAAPPLVETETGSLSTTVESRQMITLPIGRNPQTLANFVPGVAEGPDGRIVQGGLPRKDPYYVDGAHNSLHVWGGNPVNPNPDVLQEFKVLTNSFSAEYGEASGGVMVSSTKSGTNEFHGSLFEFFRNDKLNAGNFITHQRPILRYNIFGGTVGGPIRKNKTFFFFGYQNQRQKGTSAYTGYTVPLPEFKQGDFSRLLGAEAGTDALGGSVRRYQIFDPLTARTVTDSSGKTVIVRDPFANNRIPAARLSPAALKIQQLYPAPLVDTPFANWNYFGATVNFEKNYDAKVDHNFDEANKLMVRYSRKFGRTEQAPVLPDPRAGGGNSGAADGPGFAIWPAHYVTTNYVHIFGPRATNDLHVNWFETFPRRTVAGYGAVSTKDLGINGMPNGDQKLGTPEFNFVNFTRLGSSWDTLFMELQMSKSIVNVTSIIRDRHNIRFGGEARKIRTDNFQPLPGNTQWWFSNLFTDQRGFGTSGFDYASFLLGLPYNAAYRIFPDFFRSRSAVYALFVQDDIRVSRKLTINIGLRWDAPLWYHEARNRAGVFVLDRGQYVQFGSEGFRNTPWDQNWKNFGPRFGFAYSPFGGGKTVIRGGYGIFSVGTMSSGAYGFLEADPIFSDASGGRYATVDSVNWRATLDNFPYSPSDKTGKNYLAVNSYPDHNPMAYMQQWNFSLGHEFRGVLVEAGYAANKGTHLHYGAYNANAIPLALAAQAQGRFIAPYIRYPQYPNGVNIQTWIGSSIYHSLQIKAEKRFSGGVSFLGAYTWAKTIATGDIGYRDPIGNRNLDRGIEPNSIPQRLTMVWNLEVPAGKGRRWLTRGPLVYPLGGWEVNGTATLQSGFPLTPSISYNSSLNGASFQRPNVLRDPSFAPSARTLARWYDVSAFSLPALYTAGNGGRGYVYGPGRESFNLSFAKRFYGFGDETRNLEFRGEFYNITNTPQYNNPNMTVDSPTAGRITGAGNARQIQFAMKFYF
jgi:hypothetical protein